jgi:hypothetical protein
MKPDKRYWKNMKRRWKYYRNEAPRGERSKWLTKHAGCNLHMFYLKLRFFFTRKPALHLLAFRSGTICNLRCRDCSDCCNYINEHSQFHETFENMKSYLDKLLPAVDVIQALHFAGGETFINKDMAEMVDYAAQSKQVKRILVMTNCTTIPGGKLTKALQNDKVTVYMSNYTPNLDLESRIKWNELIEYFKCNKIKYYAQPAWFWNKMPDVLTDPAKPPYQIFNVNTPDVAKKNFDRCPVTKNILYMTKGKVGVCNNMVNVPVVYPELGYEEGVVHLDMWEGSTKELSEKLVYLFSKDYYDFCKYCNFPPKHIHLMPAIQIEKEAANV